MAGLCFRVFRGGCLAGAHGLEAQQVNLPMAKEIDVRTSTLVTPTHDAILRHILDVHASVLNCALSSIVLYECLTGVRLSQMDLMHVGCRETGACKQSASS